LVQKWPEISHNHGFYTRRNNECGYALTALIRGGGEKHLFIRGKCSYATAVKELGCIKKFSAGFNQLSKGSNSPGAPEIILPFALCDDHSGRLDRPVDLRLIHLQALHQPSVLLSSNASGVFRFSWPLEASVFQPLVEQNKSVPIPVQSFDPVGTSSTEQKQRLFERVKLVLFPNQTGKSINTTPKIGIATCDNNLIRMEEVVQHDRIARSTLRMVSSSAPWKIFTAVPFISMLAMAASLGLDRGTS